MFVVKKSSYYFMYLYGRKIEFLRSFIYFKILCYYLMFNVFLEEFYCFGSNLKVDKYSKDFI